MEKNWSISNCNKKVLRFFHIIFAASMLGGLIAILVILIIKTNYSISNEDVFGMDLSILKIYTWGVSYAFFGLILISLILGLFTQWGFLRYRWIIVKWLIALIMFVISWFGLGPAIGGMTSIADAGLNNSTMTVEYINFQKNAVIFCGVEIMGLLLIFLISVLKPWGVRNVKERINQKTVVAILLPLIIIGIGFAAFNAIKLNKIRNMPIKNIDFTEINDGTYSGEAEVGSYIYKVKVEVENHKIVDIKGIDNRKSSYVTYAEGVFGKIIKQQKIDVDAVTGATTTSKAFMKAVENSLEK